MGDLTKPIMLKYFQKYSKPSILAKIQYEDLKLENFS